VSTAADSASHPADAAADGPAAPRRLRRDAERNRQRILHAAATVFTEQGIGASLDEVARQAGVGVGTVYRRFPDKATLVDALFQERIDTLLAAAGQAEREPDSWVALVSFIERAAEMMTGDRGLRQMLMYAAHGHHRATYARDQMRPVVARLLSRAQADGHVRADLGPTDVPVIEFMLSALAEYTRTVRPEIWRRYLALMLDALRPAGASPLPQEPLSPDEMVEVINSNPVQQGGLLPPAGRPQPGTPGR
jgi:AcrR family transcriptional regulator